MHNPIIVALDVPDAEAALRLAEIGCAGEVEAQVVRLAKLAAAAGLRGLVCSPLEIVALRKVLPREAIAAGANWLVIGRPIYAAPHPRAAAEAILRSLQ